MTDETEFADPHRYAEMAGFEGGWRDLFWNEDFLELTARRLDFAGVRTVLDVGCGAGHWGRRLLGHLPPTATITGVDREPHFLALAGVAADEAGIGSRVRHGVGDATALPFPDDTFDLVTCQTVLIHVPDVPAVLKEMRGSPVQAAWCSRQSPTIGPVIWPRWGALPRFTARICSTCSRWPRPAGRESDASARATTASVAFCPACSRRRVSTRFGRGSTTGASTSFRPIGPRTCDAAVRVSPRPRCAMLGDT